MYSASPSPPLLYPLPVLLSLTFFTSPYSPLSLHYSCVLSHSPSPQILPSQSSPPSYRLFISLSHPAIPFFIFLSPPFLWLTLFYAFSERTLLCLLYLSQTFLPSPPCLPLTTLSFLHFLHLLFPSLAHLTLPSPLPFPNFLTLSTPLPFAFP